MNKYLLAILICISIVMSGCSHSEGEEFILSGKITSIDEKKGHVYIDEVSEIEYKDYKKLQVGQSVKFTLYSISNDDVWDPKLIKVKSVEILNTP
ncbi:hypothetical protein [Paenibacillus sp. PL91]|uniref:hypothetical protein n=1 Tax=Paenibacillus sp. PL91 TaxID=2729538 RepID=UPI00145E9D04|nr:hypothetical protein [Paenibacillus sp. PL91]MBC9200025.1 hypothetical protein [Paenibacillus sp. PL91]